MAIFNENTRGNNNNGNREERPSANLWMNIGVTLMVENAEGVMEKKFISLPVGIPLDTTDPMEMRGSNKAWLEQVQVKNALLAFAQKTAASLEAGNGEFIDDFKVQVFKRNDATTAPKKSENSLLAQLSDMNFGG